MITLIIRCLICTPSIISQQSCLSFKMSSTLPALAKCSVFSGTNTLITSSNPLMWRELIPDWGSAPEVGQEDINHIKMRRRIRPPTDGRSEPPTASVNLDRINQVPWQACVIQRFVRSLLPSFRSALPSWISTLPGANTLLLPLSSIHESPSVKVKLLCRAEANSWKKK